MDIKCPICREPWDMDELHEVIAERYPDKPWRTNGRHDQTKYDPYYDDIKRDFYVNGCALFGTAHGDTRDDGTLAEIYAELGDDLDGLAAEMEDFGL